MKWRLHELVYAYEGQQSFFIRLLSFPILNSIGKYLSKTPILVVFVLLSNNKKEEPTKVASFSFHLFI